MNILQLMPQVPIPATDGGKVGLLHILREFERQGHSVVLATYVPQQRRAEAERLVSAFAEPALVEHDTSNTLPRLLWGVVSPRAVYMAKHDTAAMMQNLRSIVAEHRIDLIHADHTCMAPMAMRLSRETSIPWGLRLHNVEWMIWQRYGERFPVWHPARWYLRRQAALVRAEEARCIAGADVVFPITDTDQQRAEMLASDARYVVAPAGVDPDTLVARDEPGRRPHEVIMMSTYKWIHNRDALEWFVASVWPLVRQAIPDAVFRVIGKDIPAWVADHTGSGVIDQGFVPDLAEGVATASVAVAPLFVGSGMRIKVIEAMALELPVVASTIGAEGIDLGEADGLLRRDTAEDMASAIVDLLRAPERTRVLGRTARTAVLRAYTWSASVGRMLDAYRRVIDRRSETKPF